jgi:hypothetical protein
LGVDRQILKPGADHSDGDDRESAAKYDLRCFAAKRQMDKPMQHRRGQIINKEQTLKFITL